MRPLVFTILQESEAAIRWRDRCWFPGWKATIQQNLPTFWFAPKSRAEESPSVRHCQNGFGRWWVDLKMASPADRGRVVDFPFPLGTLIPNYGHIRILHLSGILQDDRHQERGWKRRICRILHWAWKTGRGWFGSVNPSTTFIIWCLQPCLGGRTTACRIWWCPSWSNAERVCETFGCPMLWGPRIISSTFHVWIPILDFLYLERVQYQQVGRFQDRTDKPSGYGIDEYLDVPTRGIPLKVHRPILWGVSRIINPTTIFWCLAIGNQRTWIRLRNSESYVMVKITGAGSPGNHRFRPFRPLFGSQILPFSNDLTILTHPLRELGHSVVLCETARRADSVGA